MNRYIDLFLNFYSKKVAYLCIPGIPQTLRSCVSKLTGRRSRHFSLKNLSWEQARKLIMQALGKDGRKKRYQDYSEGQWGYAGATILGDCLVFFHLLDEWLVTRLSPPSKWVARVRLDFILEVWIEANLPTEHLGYKFDSAPSTSKGESVFLPWKPSLLNHLQSFSDILGKHIDFDNQECGWNLAGSATVPGPGIPVDPTTTGRLPLWPSGLKSDLAPLGKCRERPFCDASWDKCAPENRDEITVDVDLSPCRWTFVCTFVASHGFTASLLSARFGNSFHQPFGHWSLV